MNGGHEILEGLPDASGLPQPLRRSLDLIQEQGTMAARHDQVLHAFGALLRLLTSVVCARYLRQEGSRLQIDRSLASNMRRPSLGHHLDFLRHCCMATDQDWGPVQPLLREVSALTLRGPDNPMVGLVEARNRTFHGARVLDEKIAGTALGPLVALLKDAVESLPALRTIQVHEGESLELLLGGVPMAWVPLAEAGDGPRIGLLEGWAERPAHLRFVGADHDWNSDRGWTEWASLLRKRSLLPTVLGDVTEAWLRGRALALRPSQCLWPDSGAMAEELLADAQRLSASGECPARDPWLAAMALTLLHEAQGRIVYVLPPGEAGQAGDAVGYFSETLGLLTPLDAVPTGHPVEVLLARVDLVLVLPTPALRRQWQELAGLVPGMRVHAVLPAWEAPAPFRSLGPLQHPLLAWRLAQAGATESQVPPDDPAWLRQVAGIHTFVETVAAGDAPPHSAFSHWRSAIAAFLPGTDRATVRSLGAAAGLAWPMVAEGDAEALHAGCILARDCRGDWGWADPWARLAGLDAALHRRLPERVALQRLDDLDLDPDPEAAQALAQTLGELGGNLAAHPLATSWRLAAKAVDPGPRAPKTLAKLIRPLDKPIPVLTRTVRLLLAWDRPDGVERLLSQCPVHGQPAELLELAKLARRSGSGELALKLLGSIAAGASSLATRALHEMAGILRDRETPASIAQAAGIYAGILARADLDPEQRLRSLTGAAINLINQGHPAEAGECLDEALRLAEGPVEPILKALVRHRFAFARMRMGDAQAALDACQEALAWLPRPLSGPLAARVLDTLSRMQEGLGLAAEAEATLAESLLIKRSHGDRLGLQKGLLHLSTLRQHRGVGDALEPALRALELATRAGDLSGQLYAQCRLGRVFRPGQPERAVHREAARLLELQLKGEG